MYRDTTNVKPEMYDYTSNNLCHWNSNENLKEKSGNCTRKTFDRFTKKTAILWTSHIIRKVLLCEAWSLSGGDHRWFMRSTGKKMFVTRDIHIIIIIIIIIRNSTITFCICYSNVFYILFFARMLHIIRIHLLAVIPNSPVSLHFFQK